MPSFTRGPETEVSARKEVEQLMSTLSQKNINVSNKTMLRAMVIPKDQETGTNPYPRVRSSLMANPQKTEEWNEMLAKLKQKRDAREKDEQRMLKRKARLDAKKHKLGDIKEEEEASDQQ